MDMRPQGPALGPAHRPADEELIQPLIDALSANVAILTLEGTICAVNAAWRTFADLNGCRSEAYCLGMNYHEVCREVERSCHEVEAVTAALQSIIAGTAASSSHAYTLPLADGTHHFKLSISRIALPGRDCIAVCHEDVTAVIRFEEQRRLHAVELIDAQDKERRQIARELHDSTAQHLAAIALLSQSMLDRQRSEITPLLQELGDIVAQAQTEIRTLSFLLHPPLLTEVGLQASLQRYIGGFSRRSGIAVDFQWDLEPNEWLGEVELVVLRIAQEALANVHRHSGATSAVVHVEAANDDVRVTISDNGVGIELEPADEGVGIPSMRSRAADLGGTLSITQNGRGTRLVAIFPRYAALGTRTGGGVSV